MARPLIYPSLLGFDIDSVAQVLSQLDSVCPGFHIDSMDGHFVPRVTGDPAFVNYVITHSSAPHQWLHLMVEDPLLFLAQCELAPGSRVSFHIEISKDKNDAIKYINEKKWKPSLAISPKTALEDAKPFLDKLDQVLVMSVYPGASGQAFLPEAFEKIEALSRIRSELGLSFRIGVDGGVNETNIKKLAELGVDDFAISSAIFAHEDPVVAFTYLQSLLD